MEFNEKLQELRKQKGFTQEELAESLYVSRTAVSKWESGRGYPNIESLKAIAKLFSVTVDELLSGDELLTIAEENNKTKENLFLDLGFGLLDICSSMLLFLPFFGQKTGEIISSASLLSLTAISPYLRLTYFIFVALITVSGILTLALQNCQKKFWVLIKRKLSLILSLLGVFMFILSRQVYVSIFLFIFLIIKTLMLIKRR